MATNYNPKIVFDGALFHIDAVNTKCYPGSGSTVTSLTGGTNLTLSGAATFSQNKFVFTESASSLMSTYPVTITDSLTDYTYSIWAKFTSLPTNNKNGVLIGAAYYSGTGIYWEVNSGVITVYGFVRGSDAAISTVPQQVNVNQVYNFTVVNQKQGNTFRIYINGSLVSTVTGSVNSYDGSLITTAGNIGISKNQVFGGGSETYVYFPGEVYCATVYTRALSASEVKQNFNALRSRYGL